RRGRGRISRLRFSRRRRNGKHVSGLPRLRERGRRRAQRGAHARARSRSPDVRTVRRATQRADSRGDGMTRLRIAAVLFICFSSAAIFAAEPTPAFPGPIPIPAGAQASPHVDPQAATDAYISLIPPAARARSDAYFEGGYWLLLWDFLYGALISILLLMFGLSAKMRDLAERITRFGPLRTMIYWIEYSIVIAIVGFPLAVYEGYFREHQYGLATQTF